MANASTIRRQISGTQQLTIAPLVYPIPGLIATAFALNNNPLTVGGGYQPPSPGVTNSNGGGGVIPLSFGVTGLYSGTGRVLKVSGQGMIVTGSGTAFVISNVALTSNVVTILATNTLVAGQVVTISGLPTATFLNGAVVTVISTGLSGSQFEFNFTHANYSTNPEAGVATVTNTLTLQVYEVPAALLPIADTLAGQQTFTNWNLIATSTARAVSGTASWSLDVRVQLDALGNLQGQFTDEINSLVDVYAPTTAVVGLVGEADLNFVVVATQTVSVAANVLTMDEFRADLE